MKKEAIKIRINADVKLKFQKLCEIQGMGMSNFLQSLINFELEKNQSLLVD
jgi:antitoxin component of RelBE/YafQ-DinJ toxin-antitoxin module